MAKQTTTAKPNPITDAQTTLAGHRARLASTERELTRAALDREDLEARRELLLRQAATGADVDIEQSEIRTTLATLEDARTNRLELKAHLTQEIAKAEVTLAAAQEAAEVQKVQDVRDEFYAALVPLDDALREVERRWAVAAHVAFRLQVACSKHEGQVMNRLGFDMSATRIFPEGWSSISLPKCRHFGADPQVSTPA